MPVMYHKYSDLTQNALDILCASEQLQAIVLQYVNNCIFESILGLEMITLQTIKRLINQQRYDLNKNKLIIISLQLDGSI